MRDRQDSSKLLDFITEVSNQITRCINLVSQFWGYLHGRKSPKSISKQKPTSVVNPRQKKSMLFEYGLLFLSLTDLKIKGHLLTGRYHQ